MSDNSAIVKIIAKHTKEYNLLNSDYKQLSITYLKVLDEKTNVDAKCSVLRKQNKDLRVLLVRFERDNKMLQESLDQCQRELMDK